MIKAIILVRVSTSKQDNDRQKSELSAVAKSRGLDVVEVCEETVSGVANSEMREGLRRAVELVETGAVDAVLVHEVSRIGRKPSEVHKFMELCEASKVNVYIHAQKLDTILENGKTNPIACMLVSIMASMAKAEREILIERTKSGLEEAKRKGVRLGRPEGKETAAAIAAKHADVSRLLRDGLSVRQIAAVTRKSTATVQKVKAILVG